MSPRVRKFVLLAMPSVALIALAFTLHRETQPGEAAVTGQSAGTHAAQSITADNFDTTIQNADKPVLVDFWAPWCGPCRMVAPAVEAVAAELGEKAIVAKLNIDHAPAVAQRYSVESIPTLIIFRGGREVDRLVGVASQSQIRARLIAAAR